MNILPLSIRFAVHFLTDNIDSNNNFVIFNTFGGDNLRQHSILLSYFFKVFFLSFQNHFLRRGLPTGHILKNAVFEWFYTIVTNYITVKTRRRRSDKTSIRYFNRFSQLSKIIII